jgi:hypothetical protein
MFGALPSNRRQAEDDGENVVAASIPSDALRRALTAALHFSRSNPRRRCRLLYVDAVNSHNPAELSRLVIALPNVAFC